MDLDKVSEINRQLEKKRAELMTASSMLEMLQPDENGHISKVNMVFKRSNQSAYIIPTSSETMREGLIAYMKGVCDELAEDLKVQCNMLRCAVNEED